MATGIRVTVLDRGVEGRLGLLGVTRGATLTRAVGVLDIGGGSTQVTVGRPHELPRVTALRIGALRLTEAVGPSDPPSWADVVAMRTVAREEVRAVPHVPEVTFTAVGGTARALLRLTMGRTRTGALGRDDLERITGLLVQRRTDRIESRRGRRSERARLLPAGTAILFALIEQLGVEAVEISQEGLREGLAIALFQHGPGWYEAISGAVPMDAESSPIASSRQAIHAGLEAGC